MGSLALLQSLRESVLSQASVKAIYGEPISAHGKTVIPVAKIMYGYGAGAGTGGVGDSSARGEGGGGGGGVRAIPVGVIEISDQPRQCSRASALVCGSVGADGAEVCEIKAAMYVVSGETALLALASTSLFFNVEINLRCGAVFDDLLAV